ncbi:uncharacterized protein N7503_006252 [Penicillium pulvis]|uniref:uncharacterized protein n=1 Tax=Penicillium pulvis TaxID=1562058 RepID=UPI002546845C|nr:uncharacterized protein N7503_006252 [Penicillium pulvis]KAJ5798747.1 hypothetical protein N7503_006252 [Penicillium pulvis]
MSDHVEDYEEDNSYAGETNSSLKDQVPVQGDNEEIEDPIDSSYSNSDQQLAADENEAVDKSNILKGDRLRHAKPQTSNKYNEGPDEDDLPAGAY